MSGHKNDREPGFYREDFGTLEIASATSIALEELGYTTYMTRSTESDLNAKYILEDIFEESKPEWKNWRWTIEASKRWKADALVSIHTNACGGTGCAAFYAHKEGKLLSASICKELNKDFNLRIRRIEKKRFMILRNTGKHNSCLVEVAFHDHPEDLKLLLDNRNITKIGKSIARGIDNHFKNV